MNQIKILFLMGSALLASSCGNTQAQSPTVSHSDTPIPSIHTFTPVPPTSTFSPTETQTPNPTSTTIPPTATEAGFTLPLPSGDPLTNWNNIPIMPSAINGEELDLEAYAFTVVASMEEIQDFYDYQLPKIGFEPFAVGQGAPGKALLIFMGDSGMLTLSILIVDEEASLYYVMIVLS
jgi:hypothetical protein